jgi:hypothetical protein
MEVSLERRMSGRAEVFLFLKNSIELFFRRVGKFRKIILMPLIYKRLRRLKKPPIPPLFSQQETRRQD